MKMEYVLSINLSYTYIYILLCICMYTYICMSIYIYIYISYVCVYVGIPSLWGPCSGLLVSEGLPSQVILSPGQMAESARALDGGRFRTGTR